MHTEFLGNQLFNENCIDTMSRMADESVDLIVTSPPYEYGDDCMRHYTEEFKDNPWTEEIFLKCCSEFERILKTGGVLVWIVGCKTKNGSESMYPYKQVLELGKHLNLNDTMIWLKKNPMPCVKQPRYNQCFEHMFVFSKGKPKTFNPIMIPCKCAGQKYDSTVKNMGGENGRTHKKFNINEYKVKDNLWKVAVNRNVTAHPATFPLQLAKDHIVSWSDEGDIIYDPFMGSGTTALAAMELNRKWIGSEISKEYCDIIINRLETAKEKKK